MHLRPLGDRVLVKRVDEVEKSLCFGRRRGGQVTPAQRTARLALIKARWRVLQEARMLANVDEVDVDDGEDITAEVCGVMEAALEAGEE